MPRFPDGFLWGAATSAYQIEGSPLADGAGMSHWHRFAHTPGNTANGETGDVACDHYGRWREDVALMKELGLTAYRFSLAWGRVLPEGRGRVNAAGVEFYSRLVDALLEAGIRPMVTLYHWDLPVALDDRGGWLNPDSVQWFADYAEVAFRALGDRVPLWATINEPWVIADGGYMFGALAPGHRNLYEAPIVSHHLLRAHGAAVQRYRGIGKQQIGLVVDLAPKDAASDSAADRAAMMREDAYKNRQYLDPVFRGEHPPELREIFGDAWPALPADDPLIRERIDFLGINYYTRNVVQHDEAPPMRSVHVEVPGATYTETGWEIYPAGLTRILLWVKERYGNVPLYVTENGCALADEERGAGGRIEDPVRIAYYRDHLRAIEAAMKQGADVRGYFAWSLLDNYEWSSGYAKKFGLVHVDRETMARMPKASAAYYAEVIRSNGGAL